MMPLLKQPCVLDYSLRERKERIVRNERRPREHFKPEPMGHTKSEKWITWTEYVSVQSRRIFAAAAAARKASAGEALKVESLTKRVTPFQRAFFEQLSILSATSEQELIYEARSQGIPNECAVAYWKARHCFPVLVPSKPLKLSEPANEGEEAP